ncbi:MAG: hypothetical protein ACKO2P_09115 [Planctomycetota bacterium]
MARRQVQLSVTLFPFLAVLVCAMGSLILLLLVMTRKIREDQQAWQMSPAKPATAASELTPAPVFVDRSAELKQLTQATAALQAAAHTLRQTITRLQQDVATQRTLVASHRAELETLRAALAKQPASAPADAAVTLDLETLKTEEQRLTAELSAAEAALLDKRDALARAEDELQETELWLFEKSSALLALRQQAAKAEAAAEKTTGTETLLEFTNPTGTSRIPIVINVTRNGYELLPAELKISAADMEQFPVRDNPLLSAVYATHRHRSGSSVVTEPYVLLLVRPGGSLPFYGAQRIFQEARIHYGYELLQPETQVLAGSLDPSERPALQRALTDVFRRRDTLYSRLFEMAREERERLQSAQSTPRTQGDGFAGSDPTGTGRSDSGDEAAAARRLAVRPDGRVVEEAGTPRRRLEGRFYAGGVAPPPTFFENRASSAVAGAPRGRLNAAQAEQMAEEFAAAYARQRALAEASAAAQQESTAAQPAGPQTPQPDAFSQTPDPQHIATPLRPHQNLRNPAEERFAESLFGGDGSLQGSRLVGSRSDAFGSVPNPQVGSSTSSPAVTAADVLASAAPGNSRNASDDTALRAPWYQSSQPDPDNASSQQDAPGIPGAPTSDSTRGGFGETTSATPRIDRETLRLLNGPARRPTSSLKVPVGIVVFLDERHLAVAQQPAVALPPDNPLVAEAALLKGINDEIQDARRSPRDDLLPVVRFVVSPGGERWRLRLARTLRQAGIASVTQYELTPYMMPAYAVGRAELSDAVEGTVQ